MAEDEARRTDAPGRTPLRRRAHQRDGIRAEGRRVVVSLKAVDAAYPLYGEVELEPALDIQTALAGGGAVVEPGLLPRWKASPTGTRSKSARRRSRCAPPWSGSRIGWAGSSASGRVS